MGYITPKNNEVNLKIPIRFHDILLFAPASCQNHSCPWVESVFSAVLRASPLPSMPGVPGLLCLSGHHAKRVIFLTAFFFPYTVCP